MIRSVILTVFLVTIGTSLVSHGNESSELFEAKIRPVLVKHCFECHAGEEVKGGLRLDDPVLMRQGGDSGEIITPGSPAESLLISALKYEEFEMPPSGRLNEKVVHDFELWIANGAVDPREHQPQDPVKPRIDWDEAKAFWAFQPPRRHRVAPSQWGNNSIDSFIHQQMSERGLSPNEKASLQVLVRRATFDLTGLPPTPEQMNSVLNDQRPNAFARYVDQLLCSSEYGPRWARLWLDIARYAEDQAHKVGNNDSLIYPNAYLYRDWVIDALAGDMPYQAFIRKQLAADMIDPADKQSHIALGFLGLGPKYYRRGDAEVMADEWEDRIDTVARGLLGLTVACARCHDHKYDPIPTADYYSLAGVFASTNMFNRPLNDSVENNKGEAKKPADAVHIVREGSVRDLNIMIRGDAKKLGDKVPRRFLTVLCSDQPNPFTEGSGRRELAEAIVDRGNPLAARVIVNRVWLQLMGRGIVATPSNFGALGGRPTHPKLLDDLSVQFMDNGWSLKWLQRQIVLSATYQQSSDISPKKSAVDPDVTWWWRMPRRRLSLEAYRDAVLAVAGQLDHQIGGKSIQPDDPSARRRTVYSEVSRMDLNPMMARFDFPDPNAHSPIRHETNTPLQKLFLLNSPFIAEHSQAFADRVKLHGGSNRSKIEYAYQLAFGRLPTHSEQKLGEEFLQAATQDAWNQYAQTLLMSNEMLIID